jgi:hypothetical protein
MTLLQESMASAERHAVTSGGSLMVGSWIYFRNRNPRAGGHGNAMLGFSEAKKASICAIVAMMSLGIFTQGERRLDGRDCEPHR